MVLFISCVGQCHKHTEQGPSQKTDSSCLVKLEINSPLMEPSERLEEFKYSGTTLTYQNSVQEEIKSGWKSRSAGYHSVQNVLSSSLVSKNIKIKI